MKLATLSVSIQEGEEKPEFSYGWEFSEGLIKIGGYKLENFYSPENNFRPGLIRTVYSVTDLVVRSKRAKGVTLVPSRGNEEYSGDISIILATRDRPDIKGKGCFKATLLHREKVADHCIYFTLVTFSLKKGMSFSLDEGRRVISLSSERGSIVVKYKKLSTFKFLWVKFNFRFKGTIKPIPPRFFHFP